MNIAKNLLIFMLIFAVIAWVFGFINFDQSSYEDMSYKEQAQNIGEQFNNAIQKGTNGIKNVADVAMESFNFLSSIISTIGNGIEKIASFFKIDVIIDNILNPGNAGEGGFQGGGGFGGGGGSSW